MGRRSNGRGRGSASQVQTPRRLGGYAMQLVIGGSLIAIMAPLLLWIASCEVRTLFKPTAPKAKAQVVGGGGGAAVGVAGPTVRRTLARAQRLGMDRQGCAILLRIGYLCMTIYASFRAKRGEP